MSTTKKLLGTGTLIAGLVFSSSPALAQFPAPMPSRSGSSLTPTPPSVTLATASTMKAYLVTATPDTKVLAHYGPHALADLQDVLGVQAREKENQAAIAIMPTRAIVYLPRSKL